MRGHQVVTKQHDSMCGSVLHPGHPGMALLRCVALRARLFFTLLGGPLKFRSHMIFP